MMYHIDNRDETDPHINLAMEEFCLRNVSPGRSCMIVYINQPSVIIGRHQNILQQVDLRFIKRTELQVVRRISGGGAVYHDFGNLNFCFINAYNRQSIANVGNTIAPIQTALKKMGVSATFNQKNDIFVNGCKISGNAQFSNTKRILIHGTLLFDSNLDHLRKALNAQADHITSAARKSVVSQVTNILPYLETSVNLRKFRGRLLETIGVLHGGMKTIRLENNQWHAIERLAKKKYRTWDWNYGKAPVFKIDRYSGNSAGPLRYSINVENGHIAAIRFGKESAGLFDSTKIEAGLAGVPFHQDAIRTRLNQLESTVFGGKVTTDNVADLLAAELGCTRKPILQIPYHDLF